MLDEAQIEAEVKAALGTLFHNYTYQLRPSAYQYRYHLVIASPELNGKVESEKQSIVHDALRQRLQANAQQISLVIPYSIDELYS